MKGLYAKIGIYRRAWRLAGILLLVAAILGPWAYDQINVPAQYPCSSPFVRLEGDFCGVPLSGMWMITVLLLSLQPVLMLLLALSLLPLVSTLVLVLRRDQGRMRWLQYLSWGGALILGGLWLVLAVQLSDIRLWGPWVYTGAAGLMLALEFLSSSHRGDLSPDLEI